MSWGDLDAHLDHCILKIFVFSDVWGFVLFIFFLLRFRFVHVNMAALCPLGLLVKVQCQCKSPVA